MSKERTCGECAFNQWNAYDEEFYCENKDSDYYGCATFFDDTCEEYEEK